jgi:DNA polymerase-1
MPPRVYTKKQENKASKDLASEVPDYEIDPDASELPDDAELEAKARAQAKRNLTKAIKNYKPTISEDLPPTKKKFPPIDEIVGIDFETVPDTYTAEILAMSWGRGSKKIVSFDLTKESIKKEFFKWLDKCRGIVAHNAVFELKVIREMGYDVDKLYGRVDDSMLAIAVCDMEAKRALKPNAREMGFAMKEWEEAFMGSREDYIKYCEEDATACRELLYKMLPTMQKLDTLEAYKLELGVMFWVIDAMGYGFKIDVDKIKELRKSYEKKIQQSVKRMVKMSGSVINFNSPLQVGDLIFNKMRVPINPMLVNAPSKKTGKVMPKVDSQARKYYINSPKTPKKAAEFLSELEQYKKYLKLVTTYLSDKFLNYVGPDGRLRAEPKPLGARTGRFSYANPNLQNIPKKGDGGDIRKVFVADKGYYIVRTDLSQFEYRLLAHFSEDPFLMEAYKAGRDLHKETGELFGVDRDAGKLLNFAVIYGLGVTRLAKATGKTVGEASSLKKQYFERFSRVSTFVQDAQNYAKHMKQIPTLSGRIRGLAKYADLGNGSIERLAPNTIIQGANAEIVKMIIVKQRKELKPLGYRCLLQVHDELVFEVPNRIPKEKAMKTIGNLMRNTYKLKVPIECSIHASDNWTEAESD